jgi:hypothetical protein
MPVKVTDTGDPVRADDVRASTLTVVVPEEVSSARGVLAGRPDGGLGDGHDGRADCQGAYRATACLRWHMPAGLPLLDPTGYRTTGPNPRRARVSPSSPTRSSAGPGHVR